MGVAPSETWRRGPGDCGSPSRTIELNPSGTAQESAHLSGQLGLHGPHGSRAPMAIVEDSTHRVGSLATGALGSPRASLGYSAAF